MKNVSNSKSETRVDVVGLVTKIRLFFKNIYKVSKYMNMNKIK